MAADYNVNLRHCRRQKFVFRFLGISIRSAVRQADYYVRGSVGFYFRDNPFGNLNLILKIQTA